MQQSYTEKIQNLVINSAFSSEEKAVLLNLFAQISGNDAEELFALLSSDPAWLQKIIDNYRAKQRAMDAGDSNLWEKIMQDEEAQLTELEAG
ncbi:MAG: hypothetical protein HYZ69_04200 [Candidatus Colwellbacteria bacterium]|nr:hypothetical protein [Candidatus Colwellbacteria bacterium]